MFLESLGYSYCKVRLLPRVDLANHRASTETVMQA